MDKAIEIHTIDHVNGIATNRTYLTTRSQIDYTNWGVIAVVSGGAPWRSLRIPWTSIDYVEEIIS